MDINTRLENEELFINWPRFINWLEKYHEHNIYTVNDFINADITKITNQGHSLNELRVMKKILKYKYLNESMDIDDTLNMGVTSKNVYTGKIEDIFFRLLGFGRKDYNSLERSNFLTNIYNGNITNVKIIDLINAIPGKEGVSKHLIDFYINYYFENQKDLVSLKKYKERLLGLIDQRIKVDKEINYTKKLILSIEKNMKNR